MNSDEPFETGPAVTMRGVWRSLPDDAAGEAGRVDILRDVDMCIERGSITHVVGPSGSGKTSLIRLINRLDERTSGTIEVLGRSIEAWSPRELRRRVALVFQEPSLLGRSVRENLELSLRLGEQDPAMRADDAIDHALTLAGCDRDWLDRTAPQLSVGQRQRVTLARAIVAEPDILLLDEPTGALDPRTADRLLDRLAELRTATSTTMIMTTHRIDETRRVGGAMVVMLDGRVAASGDVARVLDHPPNEEVRAFFAREEPDA